MITLFVIIGVATIVLLGIGALSVAILRLNFVINHITGGDLMEDVKVEEFNICMNADHTTVGNEIIVPIVIMKTGVFNSYLKTPEDLEQSTKWWEGIPLVIENKDSADHHPDTVIVTNKTVRIGQVRDVSWNEQDEKLVAKAHIDTELCPDWLLKDIESGSVKGVSGTYFTDLWKNDGSLGGKKYTHVEKNYVPNNISIVKDPACSPEDGCGLNMNEKKDPICNESEYELDENCNPKLNEAGEKILKEVKAIQNEGDNMADENVITDMQKKLDEMGIQMNELKETIKLKDDEIKVKDEQLMSFENARKETEFLAQFPEMNREAAKAELLPVFMENPGELVMNHAKRLGELLVEPGTVIDKSVGTEHVDLDLGDVETNEDKEIEEALPDMDRVRDLTRGRV